MVHHRIKDESSCNLLSFMPLTFGLWMPCHFTNTALIWARFGDILLLSSPKTVMLMEQSTNYIGPRETSLAEAHAKDIVVFSRA